MESGAFQLAQVNIARLRAPIDSPLLQDFVTRLPEINALAEASPGFVWRLQTSEGDATAIHPYGDPMILFNLSVWESVEALREYAYRSGHVEVFREREKWFEKMDAPSAALWWIRAGRVPSPEEAVARLEHLRRRGPTAEAFSFRQTFPASESVRPGVNLDGRVFEVRTNSQNGDAGGGTRFHYRQDGLVVWASYAGGAVQSGNVSASVDGDATLDANYRHLNLSGDLRTGVCRSRVEVLPDGRVRLHESWRWTNGDLSEGRSVVEEILL